VTSIKAFELMEELAEHGTAPSTGCALFGVGYEDAYRRLRDKYLLGRFERGRSAEKFVIGPFGSGKSHFSRQLMEIARDMGCVTAEVQLNKDLDFAQNLVIYREVVRAIRPPYGEHRGIRALLMAALDEVRRRTESASEAVRDQLVNAWVTGLESADFELELFGQVAKRGLEALIRGEVLVFEAACRWLGGEVADRQLARDLCLTSVPREEQRRHGRLALLSLFQFIRHAGFQGTVLAYDEAEQGLSVDRRKEERIHSLLQSDINAVTSLKNGSVLILYAFTPDIVSRMEKFPALAQRIADPSVEHGFFDGNTFAPRIDLTRRGNQDPAEDLRAIGHRLVDLLYEEEQDRLTVSKVQVLERVTQIANEIVEQDITTSNRRTMVKLTATVLSRLYENGQLIEPPKDMGSWIEDEV